MKTINKKNKIILCLTTVLSLTIVFVACKKDDSLPTNDDVRNSSPKLRISYSIDGKTNFINESPSQQGFFEWTQKDDNQRNDEVVKVGNIAFDLTSIPVLTILSKGNNSLMIEMDDREYAFMYNTNNIGIRNDNNNTTTLTIETESGRIITFNSFEENENAFPTFLNFVNPGDKISIELVDGEYIWYNHDTEVTLPFWPFVVYGIICIIAEVIDYQCDEFVREGVAECTRQNKLSVIGTEHCSVTCIDPKQTNR